MFLHLRVARVALAQATPERTAPVPVRRLDLSLLRDALKTNPNYAAAHWELGYAYRFAGMLNESGCGVRTRPANRSAGEGEWFRSEHYLYLGEYDKFLASLPDADNSAFPLFYRGFGEYHQKNWDRAAQDFDRAFDLDPYLYMQIGKFLSDSILHRGADGLEILHGLERKIGERGVGDPEETYKIAEVYSLLGEKTADLRLLRSSVEYGFFAHPYLVTYPLLDPLRNEPQFAEILYMSRRRHQAFKDKFF